MSNGEELPKGWCMATIQQLNPRNRTCAYGVLQPGQDVEGGIPFVRVCDVADGRVAIEQLKHIDPAISDRYQRTILQGGEVLLTIVGTIGRSAVVPESLKGANTARAVAVIPVTDSIDARYVELTFRDSRMRAQLTKTAHEVARKTLNLEDVRAARIPLAPLNEQRRIVAKIEELFSDLDAGVAALERAKANLKRYRAAVLKAAVEGRLTEKWRAENPPTEPASKLLQRILVERHRKWEEQQLAAYAAKGTKPPANWKSRYKEPDHEEGCFALPRVWIWASALEVCEVVENGNTPPAEEMFAGSGDVPFIKVYNLTKTGRLDFSVKPTFVSSWTHEHRLPRSKVRPGDVLMNIVGPPLGKVSVVPDDHAEWNTNQAVVLFRPSCEIKSQYLAAALLCEDVLHWITRTAKATAGQFNISVGNSRKLPIPLPPADEQMEITAILEAKLGMIEYVEAIVDQQLGRSARLRQSILKRAFEGKLVPQDPADEPATELLARIQAERNGSTAPPKKQKRTQEITLTKRKMQSGARK